MIIQRAKNWLQAWKMPSKEGLLLIPNGKVWYRLVGKGKGSPIVVIHGGPGFPHDYLESLLPLAKDHPILFYDQLGCGRSDRPTDTSLWTMERLVGELGEILRQLNITEYSILGHSSGAMVALDFALTQPQGLKALILASPIVRIADWLRDINAHRVHLPADVREAIERGEADAVYDTQEFQQATNAFYARYVLRMKPWPESYVRAGLGMSYNVYRTMWGPTEFIVDGNLRDYDQVDRLKEIRVPTLFTCGRFEGAKPETLLEYAQSIPGAAVKVFDDSAHMPHLEETERYILEIRSFLGSLR